MPIPTEWPASAEKRATAFLTLFKYCMWSAVLAASANHLIEKRRASGALDRPDSFRSSAFLSYWFASLFVLTEGWNKLGLHDGKVDSLIANSARVETLRRFRNGVFHFQSDFMNARFQDLESDADTVEWAVRLSNAYMDYFTPHSDAIDVERIRAWLFASEPPTA